MTEKLPADKAGSERGWLPKLGLYLGGLVLLGLIVLSLAGPIMNWPAMDEGNYILEALKMANGQLPYRDFYEFITPGGQLLGALFIKLNGFSVLGLRLLVLVGWLLSLLLVCEMTKARLSKPWLALLLAFLWLTFSRYPIYQHHFWSGLLSTVAVYFAWRTLKPVYLGERYARFLVASGVFTALVFWVTQSLGVMIALALGGFGVLHNVLHEREEQGVSFREVSRMAVLRRWANTWGRFWLLPMLAVHGVWIGAFVALGIWDDFWRDSVHWLFQGHYQKTTVIGYFATFHQEFMDTIRPFLDQVPMPGLLLFLFRLPIVAHLVLIGCLPIVGLLGAGYQLPGRFLYRLLKQEDEEWLLALLASLALVVSTFNYSGSMHIVSNGTIPFMLGWLVCCRWFSSRPKADWEMRAIMTTLSVLLLMAALIGSGLQLLGGVWLPRFRGMTESLLYTETQTNALQFLTVVNLLEEAQAHGRSVFVFSETPSLYLPGLYQNATRFTLIIPVYTSKAQMQEIMADLERNQPVYIVDDQTRLRLHTDGRFRHYPQSLLRMPEMEAYIHAHYTIKAIAGRYFVYRRIR